MPRDPPYYLASTAAMLVSKGCRVTVQDYHTQYAPFKRILRDISDADPSWVGIFPWDHGRTTPWEVTTAITTAVQEKLSVPVVVLGRIGQETAVRLLRQGKPTGPIFVCGEPEYAATLFEEHLRSSTPVSEVPGVVMYRDGRPVMVQRDRPRMDLDRLPPPAWHLLEDMKVYQDAPHKQGKEPIYPVIAGRGCPYPCSFCLATAELPYRLRSVEATIGEVRHLQRRYRARKLFLADPTFAIDRQWALGFCEQMEPLRLRWFCMTRPDLVDTRLLAAMADAGCESIHFGLESSDREVQRIINRVQDLENFRRAIAGCREVGIASTLSCIIGLPGDTPEKAHQTIEAVFEMDPDTALFHRYHTSDHLPTPPGGTVGQEWLSRRFDYEGPLFIPDGFTGGRAQVDRIRRNAYRRFYFRRRFIKRYLGTHLPKRRFRSSIRGLILALRLATGREP